MVGAVADIEAAEVASWRDRLEAWFGLIADDFFRFETRRHAKEYLTALLAPIGGAGAVLVVDDTGFLKQVRYSARVRRQYAGTSGKVDNCQIGAFAALVDRELYLPASWTGDPDRCRRVGVPDERLDHGLITKPSTARRMIARLRDAGLAFGWVAADAAYALDHLTRRVLEEARISYVLAVKSSQVVADTAGDEREIANLIAEAPAEAWTRLSGGDGERGPRVYNRAWGLLPPSGELRSGYARSVLACRSVNDSGDIAYYLCFAPEGTSEQQLIGIAGAWWGIQTCFAEAKGQCGMDHYQVRTWTSWYRHVSLAMFAHAFLQTATAMRTCGSHARRFL